MGVALYRWGLLASMTVGSHTPRVSVIYCDRCQSSSYMVCCFSVLPCLEFYLLLFLLSIMANTFHLILCTVDTDFDRILAEMPL